MNINRNLLGKIVLQGLLKCETGMHIGASKENIEIGAIDSPVVRDPVTREPYIPGSSLKGKLRALLEKALSSSEANLLNKRNIGTPKNPVEIHVCNNQSEAFKCKLCRIFGSTSGRGEGNDNFPSRLIVRDLYLTNESVERLSDIDTGLLYTEWKFENAIDRVTSAANPRQIERVPRGAEFGFEIIYNVEETTQIKDDLKNIRLALDLLQLDALGGHGSRGYGKVSLKFEKIEAMTVDYLKNKTTGQYASVNSFDEFEQLIKIFNGKTL
ncbi:MAG: type III-A CRISPR-associated RAMP protein Csm3 [Syntrophorhabdaceae bacterium]|nr:type III-A CRISPR-associated RAMP protein Csm3 [Syntrophorhabdaceae bacterium]